MRDPERAQSVTGTWKVLGRPAWARIARCTPCVAQSGCLPGAGAWVSPKSESHWRFHPVGARPVHGRGCRPDVSWMPDQQVVRIRTAEARGKGQAQEVGRDDQRGKAGAQEIEGQVEARYGKRDQSHDMRHQKYL